MSRVGFVAVARPTFDVARAVEVAAAARECLSGLGHDVVGSADPVVDDASLAAAADRLRSESLDALVVVQATFTDASVPTAVADANPAPLILWAVPEPRTGGRLRLNSFCGVNLAGYRLTREGRRYRWIHHDPEHPAAADAVTAALAEPPAPPPPIGEPLDAHTMPAAAVEAAQAVLKRLRTTKVGVIGEPPLGFEPCVFDAAELAATTGVVAERAGLDQLFARAESAGEDEAGALHRRVEATLAGLDELDPRGVDRSLRLHLGLRGLVDERGWAAVATRCWPECFTEFGGAACTPQALLADDGVPSCCEADGYGTVTSLILQWLAGGPAFVADLVDVDPADDTGVVWHCGLAPTAMAPPDVAPRATVHPNRHKPLLNEFPLRAGRVTIARLSQSRGVTRLTIGGGEMLDAPRPFSGTAGVLRFDRPGDAVVETVLREGLEHHYGIVYGDVRAELTALAALLGLPVVEL